MSKDVAEEYTSSLADLTVNSKPLINMLTMLAEDYVEHAPIIVKAVEAHLQKVRGEIKLPVLYLIDSIVKNVGKEYISLFTQNIVSNFCSVFEKVDEKIRAQMFKLRQTWSDVFPSKKLYALDARVNAIDPAWPITAAPPHGRIHVNPKFLSPASSPGSLSQSTSDIPSVSIIADGTMQEELLTKKKELLELQKRKVELELLQTKAILEEQQRKLESQTAALKSEAASHSSINKKMVFKPESKRAEIKESMKPNTSFVAEMVTETNPQHQNFYIKGSILRRDPRRRLRPVNDQRSTVPNSANSQPSAENSASKAKKADPVPVFVDENKDDNSKSKTGGSHAPSSSSSFKRKSDRVSKKHNRDLKSHHVRMFYQKIPGGDKGGEQLLRGEGGAKTAPPQTFEPVGTSSDPAKVEGVKSSSSESSLGKVGRVPSKKEREGKKRSERSERIKKSKASEKSKLRSSIERDTSEIRKTEKERHPENTSPLSASPRKPEKCDKRSDSPQTEKMDAESKLSVTTVEEPQAMETETVPPETASCDPQPAEEPIAIDEPKISVEPVSLPEPPTKSESDVDLRLLLSPNSETDQPPEKKSKSEIIDKLFGESDVDLRKFPPRPPTPPPPVISNPIDLTSEEEPSPNNRSWANIKRSNPEFADHQICSKKKKSLNSPFKPAFSVREDTDDEVPGASPREDIHAHSDYILKQAEEELKHGNITFFQYNQMLKDVMNLKEKKRIMESMEALDSPVSFSGSSVSSDSTVCDKEYQPYHDTDDHSSTGKSSSPRKSDRVSDQSLEDGQGSADIPFSDNDGSSNKRPFFSKNHDQQLSRKEMRNRYHGAYPEFSGSKPWMSRPTPVQQQHSKMPLPRDSFFNQRWVGKAPLGRNFDTKKPGFQSRYGPPMRVRNLRHPQDLPPADPAVLEMIKNDPMALVNVGGAVREVRFYGESAVIMMAWDDPRDLTFQSGCRRVIFDDVDVLSLQFNAPYRDYTLNDGIRIKIRLGAPTRELFIDGRFYDIKFGGAPIEASLKGRIHRIQLEGPIPFLKIGHVKRTDLVVGKVNLIVDANVKDMFPIYLDAKPQRFDVGGVPFILRFVEALQTVVINGRPFKVDFGGMPFPIYFHEDKHFLRMTHLPEGVVPGYVNVLNMEGGRIPSPPPNILQPTPLPPPPAPFTSQGLSIDSAALPQPPYFTGPEKRFELLSSLLPSQQIPPFPVQAYNIEQYQEPPATVETTTTTTTTTTTATATATSPSSAVSNTASTMNLSELIQRLVESGIVPAVKDKDDETQDDKFSVKVVDFAKPETLKVKQPGLVNKLYSGLQCGTCGVRFPPEFSVKYSQHLDWHFRQNRKERDFSKIAISRRWNFDISDWIQYQEIEDIEDRAQSWFEIQEKKNSKEEEEEQMEESTVPAKGLGEHPCCSVCQDRFDQFFNEEKEEWQLKRAVCIEDKLYHPLCYRDFKENPGHLIPMLPLPSQEEIPEIVETIVLDDSTPGVSSEDEKIKGLEGVEVDSTSATTEDVTSLDNVTTEETSSKVSGEEGDTDKDDEANTSMDDDLVVVGVVQPVVEQYEILDDDDEETIELEESKEEEEELREGDEVIEMDEAPPPVRIKTENMELSPPHIGPPASHPSETVSLDGNTEFTAPTTVVLPKKIKITISSLLPKPTLAASTEEPHTTNSDSSDVSSKVQTENTVSLQVDFMEPLLLTEELCPVQIKPKIVKSKLIDMPPISQGKEMSGLCSIM